MNSTTFISQVLIPGVFTAVFIARPTGWNWARLKVTERDWPRFESLLHPKKVGTLPVAGNDEQKRTNEIGMAIPLLEGCNIGGKVITADALLTQRKLAD